MAENNLSADEEIIDLTELIETGEKQDSNQAVKAYKNAASGSEDTLGDLDFEDMLAAVEKKDTTGTPAQARPVDAHEKLDMSGMNDIDNLFDSLDIPSPAPKQAPPIQKAPEKPPVNNPASDETEFGDLDSVLDDLLGEPPAQPDFTKKNSAPASPVTSADKAADISETSDLAADLDDILASVDSEPKESLAPETNPQVEEALTSVEIADEISDIDLIDENVQGSDESEISETLEEDQNAEQVILNDNAEEMVEETVPDNTAAHENKDDLTGNLTAADNLNNEDLLLTEKTKSDDEVKQDLIPAADQPRITPEFLVNLLQNISRAQFWPAEEKIQDFIHKLGAQSAHLEDLAKRVEELNTHIHELESSLNAANTRIAVLEKGAEKALTIETLFTEGSALQKGFTEIISSSVAQAVEGFKNDHAQMEKINLHLSSLDTREKSDAERLDMLEKIVDGMKEGFNKQVEQAATQAVTNILHEEINRLLTEN